MSLLTVVENQIETFAYPGLTGEHGYALDDIVALQGPVGLQGPKDIDERTPLSYHRIGAEQRFGTNVLTEGFSSFEGVFNAVESGYARYGIVAVRSELVGPIGDEGALPNEELIQRRGLRALGLVGVDIQFDLLGIPSAELDGIKTIVRQGTANVDMQCSDWLGANLPDVAQADCEDGLVAGVELLAEGDPSVGVIASPEAAKLGLEPLATSIQDLGARTLFAVVARPDMVNS